MESDRSARRAGFTRRQALVAGAAGALSVRGILSTPPAPAHAAVSPKLPGEVGRQNNWTSRFTGRAFDHIRVRINGDDARLFVPQGVVPGQQDVGVLWLYHVAGSSHDALIGGYKVLGERAVDLGLIAICQNLGGTLYSHPRAVQWQVDGATWLSGIYGVGRSFLRGNSHGGAMAVESLARSLVPNAVGAYVVNGVYDLEHQYHHGSGGGQTYLRAAFGDDLAALRAANPARHVGDVWSGKRLRVVYSQPDESDASAPPQFHGKALVAAAAPFAAEASVRTHLGGHSTPSFADLDNHETIARWTEEIRREPEQPGFPEPVARWDFAEKAAPFASSAGSVSLAQGAGSTATRVTTPFGGGIELNGRTDYLRVPAESVGPLNVGATTGSVTVAAWVYSTDTNNALIAGCWRESSSGGARSYGLFNDLPTYGGDDRVCMSVSRSGGPTAGYAHSIDYAADPRRMTRGTWQFHVGTYDGAQAVAYLDGTAEAFPSYTDTKMATYAKNPYAFAAGLNGTPTDFLVGAGVKDGALNNLHRGRIARLRVWNVALTAGQVAALYEEEAALLAPAPPLTPGLIASYEFAEAAAPFASSVAGVAALQQGALSNAAKVATPFGGGVTFDGKVDHLLVPAAQVGKLNVGASTGEVTVAAWVHSTDTNNALIAGCWQESLGDPRRSYALFNDLPMYGGDDMVCMQVSKFGGATPGYPFSIDYAAEPRKITRNAWHFHVGTYDGEQAIAYLDGLATPYPTYTDRTGATYAKNPFIYPDGLNATPVDFTVCAVVRDGSLINLHKGTIARLRVWDRALSPEEIEALYEVERRALV